jgi:hypothetical protein
LNIEGPQLECLAEAPHLYETAYATLNAKHRKNGHHMAKNWEGAEVNLPEDVWPYSFKKWLSYKVPDENKKAVADSPLSLLIELYATEYDEWFDICVRLALKQAGVDLNP